MFYQTIGHNHPEKSHLNCTVYFLAYLTTLYHCSNNKQCSLIQSALFCTHAVQSLAYIPHLKTFFIFIEVKMKFKQGSSNQPEFRNRGTSHNRSNLQTQQKKKKKESVQTILPRYAGDYDGKQTAHALKMGTVSTTERGTRHARNSAWSHDKAWMFIIWVT